LPLSSWLPCWPNYFLPRASNCHPTWSKVPENPRGTCPYPLGRTPEHPNSTK
jgi:hypothetical protein